jgi:hypothetical protein
MSGMGVGSDEMRSILINDGQVGHLQLILNDLKTKLGYVILFWYSSLAFSCVLTLACVEV